MVDEYLFTFEFAPDCYNNQKMYKKTVSKDDSHMLKYCLDKNIKLKKCVKRLLLKCCPYRCITQEMCEKAANPYISTLKFVPDWFVTPKILKNLDYCLLFNDLGPECDFDDNSGYIKSVKFGSKNTITGPAKQITT